jgi:tetratricopeptide (TPR) repeat protein
MPGDYNNVAWYALSAPAITQEAVENAQKAVSMSSSTPAYIHTLATLYAEQGKTSEAKAAIWEAIDAAGAREPRSHDVYVLGRIAEEYGIREAAIAAYRRVEKEPTAEEDDLSTWSLAQKRLKRLGAK